MQMVGGSRSGGGGGGRVGAVGLITPIIHSLVVGRRRKTLEWM